MTVPVLLDGMAEVVGALTADAHGQLRDAKGPEMVQGSAAAAAVAVSELTAAGGAIGMARLELVLVKGARNSTVTAVRANEILLVALDPTKPTAQVEKVLQAWASNKELPAIERGAGGRPPTGSHAAVSPAPPVATPPAPAAQATASRAQPPGPATADAWAAFRHALVRGQLTEAATRRRDLAASPASGARVGAEPVTPAELDAAMQVLMQGIGSVLAGDGIGGARTLEELTGTSQKNVSFRWLALYWCGRAALKSGNSAIARTHLTQALLIAKQLDVDAVAASQWIAAEVLTHDGDHRRALACLVAARAGFEKLGDRWGLGQTWLAEARVLVATDREEEGIAAARQAWATDPVWEEPAVFLARRALVRNDLAEAEGLLRYIAGPSAERVRGLIDSIRQELVSAADASAFLLESDAPPTVKSIRAMERIAQAAPRFVQAREALAWMLLKVGKYAEASTIFRGLLSQQLTQSDRASVMLGLGCIAHAQQTGKDPDTRLQAAVMAGASAPEPEVGADVVPLPSLSGTSLPARSSQVASSAVFSGQLSVFALPDVIEFVRSARRTGLLVCSSEKGMAAVHFRDGRITGATSTVSPDIGEILVAARKLSTVALRALAPAQPDQPDHVLGARLIQEGLVDERAVREALRRKVELTIAEVLKWKDGEFAFNREGDSEPSSAQVPVEFDAQDVLLNVLKQIDEDARGRTAPGARR
jgi:tetratricopeptide (TPR) repeat protein